MLAHSLPPLSPQGIFLILHLSGSSRYFWSFTPPSKACLFVCQQVIKICLLLPRWSTLVETAAAEPRSWSPLLHADDLNVKGMKNIKNNNQSCIFFSQPLILCRWIGQKKVYNKHLYLFWYSFLQVYCNVFHIMLLGQVHMTHTWLIQV